MAILATANPLAKECRSYVLIRGQAIGSITPSQTRELFYSATEGARGNRQRIFPVHKCVGVTGVVGVENDIERETR